MSYLFFVIVTIRGISKTPKHSFFILTPKLRGTAVERCFFVEKRGNMELNNIYCPRCKRRVGCYNKKTRMKIQVKCRRCNKLVTFNPVSKDTSVSNLPERTTASGTRLY